MLAESLALIAGSTSVLWYAAWAVDELPPSEAFDAGRIAQTRTARERAKTVCENIDPGARRDRQHVGMPGARVPATRPGVHQPMASLVEGDHHWTFVIHPRRPRSGTGCGSWLTEHKGTFPKSRRRVLGAQGALASGAVRGGLLRRLLAQGVRRTGPRAGLRRHRRRGDRDGGRAAAAQPRLLGASGSVITAARNCSNASCRA